MFGAIAAVAASSTTAEAGEVERKGTRGCQGRGHHILKETVLRGRDRKRSALLMLLLMVMMMVMVMVVLLLVLLLRERTFRAYRCAWRRLLHIHVQNVLGHHAKPILTLWRWQSGTGLGLRLGWGLTLDGVHRSVEVDPLRLSIVEVDSRELDLIDARQGGRVHLQWVQGEPKSRGGTSSTESESRAVVHRDRRLVCAGAKDEIAGVVRVVRHSVEGTAWHHLGVAERAEPVMFGTRFGGKVVRKGGGEKVISVEDTMSEMGKSKRGVWGGRHATKVGRRARVGRRLIEAGVCREPVRGTPRGLAHHGHAIGAKAAP